MHGTKTTYDCATNQYDAGTRVVLPVCVQAEEFSLQAAAEEAVRLLTYIEQRNTLKMQRCGSPRKMSPFPEESCRLEKHLVRTWWRRCLARYRDRNRSQINVAPNESRNDPNKSSQNRPPTPQLSPSGRILCYGNTDQATRVVALYIIL